MPSKYQHESLFRVIPKQIEYCPRFLVIESPDKQLIKLNPFAISKAVYGIAGDVKNIKRMRSGSLLVECA